MRYGNPSIRQSLEKVVERSGPELEEIFFVPLYPHYAMSTIETAVVAARKQLARVAPRVRLEVQPPFYDHPRYIDALVDSARPYLDAGFDHLLFSYHGLPERHLRKTDPGGNHCLRTPGCCSTPSSAFATCYRAQTFRTTEAFVEKAGVPAEKYSVAFQSRLGRDQWLEPSTDGELGRLARRGIRRLVVMCPAFVSDCLETLEEIGIRGRETFLEAGGEEFSLVPCLNQNPIWLEALVEWCRRG
jgi:ferrochelatase